MSEEKNYYTIEDMTKDIGNINKLYKIIDNFSGILGVLHESARTQLISGVSGGKIVSTKNQNIKQIYNNKYYNNTANNNKLYQIKRLKFFVDKVKKNLSDIPEEKMEKINESANGKLNDMFDSFDRFYENNKIYNYKTVEEQKKTQENKIEEKNAELEKKQKKIERRDAKIERRDAKLEEKQKEIEEQTQKITEQNKLIKEAEEKLAQTNEDLNKKQEILQNIVAEGTELKKAITTTKQQLETLKTKTKEILNPAVYLMEGETEINKQYAKLLSIKKNKEEELKELSNKYKQMNEDYIKLHEDLQEKEKEKEKLKSDIIELNKQSEEKLRELKRYDNELLNRRTAEAKHKGEEQGIKKGISLAADKVSREEATETDEREKKQIKPEQEQYIKNKVMDGIYKLPREEIIKAVQKDINDGKITTDNPEKLAAEIYLESVRYVKKNARSIAKLLKMQGYNPTQFSQLPGILQQYVNDYVTEKNKADLINKNKRYILPKDLPRWERAVQQHNVNPMLGRGAWSN